MTKNNNGVYFSFLVSDKDAEKLNDFGRDVLNLDMENSGCAYESRKHASLFASTVSKDNFDYQKIVDDRAETKIKVKPKKWKLLTSRNTGKTCLALEITSDELLAHHQEIKKITGLDHAFSDFLTHISIHYDVKLTEAQIKDLPLPDFEIELDRLFTKNYENKNVSENSNGTKKEEPEANIVKNNTESPVISSDISGIQSRMKTMREKSNEVNQHKTPKLK